MLVCDNAKGVIEDNVIACNGRAGIAILSGGDPLVMANKIHDGMDSGVLVSERGRGRIEENDIFGNRRAGVAILKEGAPLVKRNKIHDGRDSGVLVCENGKGSVVDNDIFANSLSVSSNDDFYQILKCDANFLFSSETRIQLLGTFDNYWRNDPNSAQLVLPKKGASYFGDQVIRFKSGFSPNRN